jgi:tetratricopeptide (TPR) repeat protein
LAAITRPNILLFMPVLFLFYLFDLLNYLEFKKRILCGLVLALGTLLPILPVTAINAIRGHDFVLISYEGGINFYMGNKPSADGHSAKTDKRYDYTGHYRDSVEYYSLRKMQEETGQKEIKPSEISKYWYRKSWDWMKSNPMDWMNLLFKKTVLYFSGYEIQDNKNIYFMAEQSWVLRIGLLFLNFYILLPLALIGFVFLSKSSEGRVILAYCICYTVSVIFFFVGSRYRVPILPFFILSAASGIFYGFQSRYKWIFVFSFALFFMFGFVDWYHVKQDFNPAEDDWAYGSTYLSKVTQQVEETGKYDHTDLDKAQIHLQKALEKYPTGSPDFYILQQIYLDYGKSFYVDSRYEQAREEWEKMLSDYEKLKDKPVKVDNSLLKSAHKNLAVYFQDKAKRAENDKEKENALHDAQSQLDAMKQIPE